MGLDNGICATSLTRDNIPKFVELPFNKDYIDWAIDITYWRKCWGLRGDNLAVLHDPYNGNDSHTPVDIEVIPGIVSVIQT